MQNKTIIFIITICLFTNFAFAQKVLMEKKTIDLYKDEIKKGPNLRHYHHLYINFGLTNNQSEGSGCGVIPYKSNTFATGLRYKLRLNNIMALGYNVQFSYYTYHLKQDSLKKFIPNNNLHKKEKIRFNNLGAELYLRLNIGKRGNLVGRFLDLGLYGDRAIRVKHIYLDKADADNNSDNAGVIKTSNRKLNYINKINYGVRARIGVNRYVISMGYRMSDFFKEKFHNQDIDAEFPRYCFAIEIGLHK